MDIQFSMQLTDTSTLTAQFGPSILAVNLRMRSGSADTAPEEYNIKVWYQQNVDVMARALMCCSLWALKLPRTAIGLQKLFCHPPVLSTSMIIAYKWKNNFSEN